MDLFLGYGIEPRGWDFEYLYFMKKKKSKRKLRNKKK